MIGPEQIIVALDFNNERDVKNFIKNLGAHPIWLKIGMELFYSCGDHIIHDLKNLGFNIFLDLKLHDIPNTVKSALKALSRLPIDMINVHSMGGLQMMKEARQIINDSYKSPPLLIAVTQLTSTSEVMFHNELGISGAISEHVLHLSNLAKKAGCDGVVCSAQEAHILKKEFGKSFKLVTPGIRLADQQVNDQKRIMTPKEAIKNGSDFLVIGRPITAAASPEKALNQILLEG